MQIPPCYGHLFEVKNEQCMACLHQVNCKQAMEKPKLAIGEKADLGEMPKDKKSQILIICKKFGISTAYTPKPIKGVPQAEVIITEENKNDFFNLDFLLTTKTALKRLFEVGLE